MLSHEQSVAQAIRIARKHGYFRLPVYEDEPGKIIGVLALSIWELMDPRLSEKSLSELCSPVLYVVENQPVDEILSDLRHREEHVAIVVDEFGSAIGMITLEDVLEQVIGEVVNLGYNFEAHLPRRKGRIEELGDDRYRIDGRALLSDVSETLGITLANINVHTMGGLISNRLRHLPKAGESVTVSGYRFTVESISEKGIKDITAEPV
jgi:CBS domain containing-hemolysin-like protein